MLSRFSPNAWVVSCLLGCCLASVIPSHAVAQLELSGPEQAVPPVPSTADPSGISVLDTVDAPDLPEGAEVMVTGPLHEAFAEQFSAQPEPGIIIAKKPPELINEIPPEYRPDGADIVWIPGYWGWDPEREDFLWITGIWRQSPPDRNWVPGYWAEVPEGYQWIAGFWSLSTSAEIRYLPPPPEQLAAAASTPAPSEDHFWIPGQWSYVNNNYQWRAGYWTMGYPDWVWVPDRYVWTPLGCIYRAGYWDYVVAERGTVFCPVYWSQPVANYQFRPTYVVSTGPTLLANLFVYPRYNHYCFGNYYSSRHLNQSIYSWVSYGQQSRRYDPLYGYYRTQHRDTDYMNRLLRLHNYYAANVNYQPPRTLTAQRDHHHELHDRHDLEFHAMQLNKMVGVNNNINHHMQLVKLADNERQQIQRGLDPARELWKMRADIEAKNRPTSPGNPGNARGDRDGNRNGDDRPDGKDRHWNLPSTQDGGRLGSISIGQANPRRDGDTNHRTGDQNNIDKDRMNSDRNNNDRSNIARDGRPGDNNRDGVLDRRDGRIPEVRNHNTPDGHNRDVQNRNPRDRQPGTLPGTLPGSSTVPGKVAVPGAGLLPGTAPGADRRPIDSRILPGVGAPGNPITPVVPGRTNDRDRPARDNGTGAPGRNPTAPSTGPANLPSNFPRNLPGTSPAFPNPNLNVPGANNPGLKNPASNTPNADRNRTPRINPPSSAPGEPNPGAARRSGSAVAPPAANIQNDLQKMRESSQKQIQRRTESPATQRRTPQPPTGGKPGKPEKGKDK